MTNTPSSRSTTMTVIRDPLFGFAVLAGLIFVINGVFSGNEKTRIVVDTQTAEYLIKQREDLVLRPLESEEKRELILSHVEDEVLYAEAYRRGLDRSDSRMRRNLILKMRGILGGEAAVPSTEDLRAFYRLNRDQFVFQTTYSIEQVSFGLTETVPDGFQAVLRAGEVPKTDTVNAVGLSREITDVTQVEFVSMFGPDATKEILEIKDDDWHGPISSGRGVHFVRVMGRRDGRPATFEEARRYIEGAWLLSQTQLAVQAGLDAVRNDYDVHLPLEFQ